MVTVSYGSPDRDPSIEYEYVDASSVSKDERPYYREDSYYTFYSIPGTGIGKRVVTFEERKASSFPSKRGLYVAEILLLEYCKKGKYPKPKSGYPGFWWFEYGIRDIGHVLESLEKRGFIQWRPKAVDLKELKVDELKNMLLESELPANGKKAELIERIVLNIPENSIDIPEYIPKYELTEKGKVELEENGYVVYMRKNSYTEIKGKNRGSVIDVWSINRMFPDGDATEWKKVVGEIEKRLIGEDLVNRK